MHFRPAVLAFAALVLATGLAGCARDADEAVSGDADITPVDTDPKLTRFGVEGLAILAPDGTERPLREDDAHALVRYVVRQPADAPEQTGFVTYLLDGAVVDTQTVRLKPGEQKAFERTVLDIRTRTDISVQVRTGGSSAAAQAQVLPWPRTGEPLALGPMTVTVAEGLLLSDQGLVVNLTIAHAGPEEKVSGFRLRMLCMDAAGALKQTRTVRPEAPPLGETWQRDVALEDCPQGHERYGIEFKLDRSGGAASHLGRVLLVPAGWAPPQP